MSDYFYLIPVALALGAAGLGTFLWCLRSGQYDDLDGAAERILYDEDVPLTETSSREDTPSPTTQSIRIRKNAVIPTEAERSEA